MWQWFVELSNRRGGTGFGANPITWEALQAWVVLTGNELQSWELDAIMTLDGIYMGILAKRAKTKANSNGR